MFLFEWLFEGRRRHPGGSLELEAPPESTGRTGWVLVRGLLGLGAIGGGAYLALTAPRPGAMLALLALYLLVSFVVRPQPDRTNLGLAGGLIDHPFRWSDDRNRALLFLQVVLLPGRFAVTWTRDLIWRAGRARAVLPHRNEQVLWERGVTPSRVGSHQRERKE